MYRRILVPLDGTSFGDHALPYAIEIARRTGAGLELVHVHHHREHDPDLAAMPQYQYQHISEADVRHAEEELRAERQLLEARSAEIELEHGVPVTTRILDGRTSHAVLREAQDVVADLVVLASHARRGLPRLVHGCLVHDLITQLNIPALCVHPAEDEPTPAAVALRRVLVPLDGSDFSEQIVDGVGPLLAELQVQVTLLHVLSPRPMLTSGLGESRWITSRDAAVAYLNGVAQQFRGRLPEPVLAVLEDAQPGMVITNLLAAGEYDAVAMATHGRSGLSRLVLGSVAEDVLQATRKPVLLYRPRLARLPSPEFAEAFRIYGD